MEDCKVVCDAAKDMISGLPRDIIERILGYVPLRDAAKTSILSKNWRYKWATLPQLLFDCQFFEDAARNKPLQGFEITNIVNEVLLLHTGHIHKFIICLPYSCYNHDEDVVSIPKSDYNHNRDVDRWMLFVSRNGVRELTLDNSHQHPRLFHALRTPHELPSSLFSCQELTHLKLIYYIFKSPPEFRGFQYLRSLELRSVTFATNIFETLFSISPLLEIFSCVLCLGVDHLTIDAPHLKCFRVYSRLKSIRFVNTPNMTEVSLELHKFFNIEISNLDELMGCMPRVEKLYMNNWTLKILAAGGIPKRLATPANLVKVLGLHFINFDDVVQISCALCLIRSFLNLQELELYAYAYDDAEMEPVLNFLGKQDCADCTLDQLRKVKIEGIEGSSAELEFIKHLLACSPLLELMLVRSQHYIDKDAELRICRELMRFSRASPKAEIVYCN